MPQTRPNHMHVFNLVSNSLYTLHCSQQEQAEPNRFLSSEQRTFGLHSVALRLHVSSHPLTFELLGRNNLKVVFGLHYETFGTDALCR